MVKLDRALKLITLRGMAACTDRRRRRHRTCQVVAQSGVHRHHARQRYRKAWYISKKVLVLICKVSDMKFQDLRCSVVAIGGLREDVAAMRNLLQQQRQLMVQMLQPRMHEPASVPGMPCALFVAAWWHGHTNVF